MKIAVISPFYPFRGGIVQFSNRLYTELAKNNEVKAFSFSTLYPNFLFPGKTQFVTEEDFSTTIDAEKLLSSINPLSYISTAKKINEYAPDLLIIPYWMSFLAPALGIVSRFINKKTKVISLVHNAIPHEKHFFDKAFAKFFFKKCDGFIALSEPVKGDLQKLIPGAEILLSPHPIYDHYKGRIEKRVACELLSIPSDKKNLLFFGLIREYKGLDLLIEAMSFLDDTYQLIIAGECYDNFQKYLNLIDKYALGSRVKILEQYIPDEMVTTLFSASDVLVLPYRSATQSGVLAIAYQLELPIIATNVGALGQTISSSDIGIVANEVNSKSISDSIKSYFADEAEQAQYLANIRSEKKRLSWAVFSENVLNFFKNEIPK